MAKIALDATTASVNTITDSFQNKNEVSFETASHFASLVNGPQSAQEIGLIEKSTLSGVNITETSSKKPQTLETFSPLESINRISNQYDANTAQVLHKIQAMQNKELAGEELDLHMLEIQKLITKNSLDVALIAKYVGVTVASLNQLLRMQ